MAFIGCCWKRIKQKGNIFQKILVYIKQNINIDSSNQTERKMEHLQQQNPIFYKGQKVQFIYFETLEKGQIDIRVNSSFQRVKTSDLKN